MHYLYTIKNEKNGKQYIGQTINPSKQKESHFKNSSSKSLKLDLKKYGKENFTFEIIDNAESQMDINFKEINEIDYEATWGESLEENKLYNIDGGGQLDNLFDSYCCDNCYTIFKMNEFVNSSTVGMIYFNQDVSKIFLMCSCCKKEFNYNNPIAADSYTYPLCKNLLVNTFMDLVGNYDIPEKTIDRLIIVDGIMNKRMAYAYFAKRLGYK